MLKVGMLVLVGHLRALRVIRKINKAGFCIVLWLRRRKLRKRLRKALER